MIFFQQIVVLEVHEFKNNGNSKGTILIIKILQHFIGTTHLQMATLI